jgi:drug/metabolite transporter (DMT)-like permease
MKNNLRNLDHTTQNGSKWLLWLCFAGVYILWGSTYLAIRVVLQSIPVSVMATLRFWIAGSIMFAWAWLAGHSFPNREQTARSAFSGFLLLVLGNAGVLFANRFLASSGIIAVLVAVTPFWIVLLQCGMNRANRPPLSVWLGILLGIVGMVVLVGAENLKILGENAPKGIAIVLVSTLCWAIGTLYTSSGKLPSSFAYNAGIQMFSAGICMGVLAILTNEWQSFSFAAVDSKAILSFWFLVIGGSVLGFTAFNYLARHASPTGATTYAYVNPLVALFLGWWLGNEIFNIQTLFASVLLIGAVALVVTKPKW